MLIFLYGLLAFMLLSVCYTDISSRRIKNNAVVFIAVLSLTISVVQGNSINIFWPFITLVLGMFLVTVNVIGAGDIKLISALSLSLPAKQMADFIFWITLSGIPLILIVVALRLWHPGSKKMTLPYGVAISCGYLLHLLG